MLPLPLPASRRLSLARLAAASRASLLLLLLPVDVGGSTGLTPPPELREVRKKLLLLLEAELLLGVLGLEPLGLRRGVAPRARRTVAASCSCSAAGCS